MGTRGILGVHIDGVDKLTYNHFDSYPSCLGVRTVITIKKLLEDTEKFKQQAQELTAIDPKAPPTLDQIVRCAQYTDLQASNQSTKDWYCLLRKTQGDLEAILDVGLYEDARGFASDSLFCEWGYIANLDSEEFEIYRGFQHNPHQAGRFADDAPPDYKHLSSEYYPIKLIKTFTFEHICENVQDVISRNVFKD